MPLRHDALIPPMRGNPVRHLDDGALSEMVPGPPGTVRTLSLMAVTVALRTDRFRAKRTARRKFVAT